jgi:subtilisin family serine protease
MGGVVGWCWSFVLLISACAAPAEKAVGPVGTTALQSQQSGSGSRYIVQLARGSEPAAVARAHGATPRRVYRHAIVGFSAELSDAALAALQRNPNVVRIEPDGTAVLHEAWGLDRIDQRQLPLDGSYVAPNAGAGVTVYIIDSGIRYDHADFGGRASFGADFIGGDGSDCRGHGTHVAGTVGGAQYGVAKGVALVSVRVFGCTGSTPFETIVAAVDWVTGNAVRPAVVNMSLGGPASAIADEAVANSIASGITYVLSAGNSNIDACNQSPARVPEAITVGATDAADTRASFSNWGGCVDLFAPGVSIQSAWYTSATATTSLSGTSMAAPHVTGAVAQILSDQPSLTPTAISDLLFRRSTKVVVQNPQSGNGHLLYTGSDEQPVPPGQAPVAQWSVSCMQTTCSFVDQSTDADGDIVSRQWTFPSLVTGEVNPVYRFPYGSTGNGFPWHVTLEVRDSEGRVATSSRVVYVQPQIILTARIRKQGGLNAIEYSWTGTDAGMESMVLHFSYNDYSYMQQGIVGNDGTAILVLPIKGKLAPSHVRVCQNRPMGPEYQCSHKVPLP